MSLGFPFVLFLSYVVTIVCVPFLLVVWGRMWNSIALVPGHCLFIYSATLHKTTDLISYLKRGVCSLTRVVNCKTTNVILKLFHES